MRTIGIMQPYFFPYLGYFQLIAAADEWIVFDSPQYIRHGWINRNRILKPDGKDWQYVQVPLKKHSREACIKDVEIAEAEDWRAKISGQLMHYRKKAPYYSAVIEMIAEAINIDTNSIVDLNVSCLKNVCAYLGINFNAGIYSRMGLVHEEVEHAGQWALYIAKARGASRYINPPGGRELFDKMQFEQAGIELCFLETELKAYPQKNEMFIAGLSIIDLMMFNSPAQIQEMLQNYKLT